jgi:hypothetical protein
MPVLPFMMIDGNGGTIAKCHNARIKKPPQVERGKDITTVDWVLMCGNLDVAVAGMPGGTYDPLLVGMTFAGFPIVGFGDNTFIKIERNEDDWKDYAGTDGEVVWARQHDKRGAVTFTLKISSPSNDDLTAVMITDSIPIPF